MFLHAGIKFPWFVFFQRDSGLRPKDAPWNMGAAMVIFWRHQPNIVRIIRGEERAVAMQVDRAGAERSGRLRGGSNVGSIDRGVSRLSLGQWVVAHQIIQIIGSGRLG